MELAIPLIALGGVYVISNQQSNTGQSTREKRQLSKRRQKETFTNMGQDVNYLPNTDELPQNFPVSNSAELQNNVQQYPNPNTVTDKYFNQNNYEKSSNMGGNVGNTIQQVYSLTGDYIEKEKFDHNNMVPFYGGKIKGQVYDMEVSETILDNMNGNGSQMIKKIEQAPLFKPQENMQWSNGAPNMSDFYQSRVVPGMKSNNVKPFESELIGPGLNNGYGKDGVGGFNSGMEARDEWLPKTVDQMRVATNPKIEYTLENHQGPGNSYIKNTGQIGKVEKYHPDTYFIQTQDRWLTTTGQEKAQMQRPVEEVHTTSRMNTSQSYSGVASADKTAGYIPGEYEQSKRPELGPSNVNPSTAAGKGGYGDLDNALSSHTNYTNNRSISRNQDSFGAGFSRAIGAVIAPIMDILKPTRKEEYTTNVRLYGDAGSRIPTSYVLNPNDTTPTTIKETTLYAPNFNVGNQKDGAYTVSEQQTIANQRDTTNRSSVGIAGGAANGWGDMNYDAAYNQYNNETKEKVAVSRTNHGNTQLYNQHMNVNVAKVETDRNNTRMWVPTNMPQQAMTRETYGQIRQPQQYDQSIERDRMQPDILNAFKENPYTHSLTNSV
jgi:hypothetical protein